MKNVKRTLYACSICSREPFFTTRRYTTIGMASKRWEGTVGGPIVQGFAGALIGKKARKGVFITTSTFSPQARNFASGTENLKIILIDGEQLAQLMIDHDVGVAQESRYIVKKVDLDYFDDE